MLLSSWSGLLFGFSCLTWGESLLKRTHYSNELKKRIGKEVVLSGWVYDIRLIGGINFILLRDKGGIVQITAPKAKVPKEILEICNKLHQEDVLAIKGKVIKSKIAKTGVEIIPSEIEVVNKAEVPLPLDPREVTPANLDTRLDHRALDLRKPKNLAIFKIRAVATQVFRDFFVNQGFIEINTPSLTASATEGGTEVFPVVYYDKKAFLRQSPQLYKEMMIGAGFEKVFETGPVFRAEPHHTTRHLTEYFSCDVEMAWIKDEEDLMRIQENLIVYLLKQIRKKCRNELKILNKKVEIPKVPFPEINFPEVYKILEKIGKKLPYGEDLDSESEKLIGKLIKKRFRHDLVFIRAHPFKVRPFYTMKNPKKPEFTKSIDLLFKGLEITTGSQREHRYEVLLKQIKEKKLGPKSFDFYLEPFKYGMPPHGGFALGIARFIMQLLDLRNIRNAVLFTRDPVRLIP